MGLSGVAVTEVARADGIFNGMNPFNWAFGRDHDDYRDRWYGPRRWYGHNRGWSIRLVGRPLRLEWAVGLPRLRLVSDGGRGPRRLVGPLREGGRGTSSGVGESSHSSRVKAPLPSYPNLWTAGEGASRVLGVLP